MATKRKEKQWSREYYREWFTHKHSIWYKEVFFFSKERLWQKIKMFDTMETAEYFNGVRHTKKIKPYNKQLRRR